MAERRDSDREVLTSLPRSRPVRRSAKRADRAPATEAAQAPTKRATKAAPKRTRAAGTGAAKATAARPRTASRTASSTRTQKAAAPRAAATEPAPSTAPRRKVPAAGYAAPQTRADDATVSAGAELISTTIQAAGELAQIGLTVGRQTLKSMLDRLPKP